MNGGDVFMLLVLLAVIIFGLRVENVIRRQWRKRRQAWRCANSQCTYFTDYIQKGPPALTHTAYHSAEESCAYWQAKAEGYVRAGKTIPWNVEKQCELFERQVRA